MRWIMVDKLKAWSYSRYNKYQNCPAKIYYEVYEKRRPPKSDAMQRGIDIHKEGEDFLGGKLLQVPDSFRLLEDDLKWLRDEVGAVPEENWAYNNQWEPTDWFDWDNAWCRVKVDAYGMVDDGCMLVVDHKTGAIRDGYEEQLELYALGAFKMFDGLDSVIVENWYVDHGQKRGGKDEGAVYTASDESELQEKWEDRVKPMMNDTRFNATPNPLCKFCDFSYHKGGPCKESKA